MGNARTENSVACGQAISNAGNDKPDLLLINLRTIGTHHCDQTVGEEAAQEIERLRAEVDALRKAIDRAWNEGFDFAMKACGWQEGEDPSTEGLYVVRDSKGNVEVGLWCAKTFNSQPAQWAQEFQDVDRDDIVAWMAIPDWRAARDASKLSEAIDARAEIEALRAEVERLRADRDSWEQQASDRVADWYAEHLRAERLTEALRKVAQALEWFAHGRLRGFDDGPLLSTSEAVELAERTLAKVLGHDDAALEQEAGRG